MNEKESKKSVSKSGSNGRASLTAHPHVIRIEEVKRHKRFEIQRVRRRDEDPGRKR
jgi:hypothetical protein